MVKTHQTQDANHEIARLMKELEAARKESSALMDACALLNTTLDLNKLLEIILSQSAILTGAEASSLALIDVKTDELCFEVVVGEKKDILKEIRLPKGAGIIGWVSSKGECLLIEDVTKDSRFYQKVDEKSQFKTSSILCVPLKTKDGTIGALEVLNKLHGEKFDLNDQSLLMALASQAAMAIENARLYQSVLEERNKIVSIVNSMGDGIIVTDDKFDIVLKNPAADKIFGNGEQDPENAFKLKVILSELSELKSDASFDLVLMKPENIILSNKMAVLKNQTGDATGAIISMRNITDIKQKENIRAQFTSTMNYKIADQMQSFRETLRTSEKVDTFIKRNAESIEEKILKLLQFSEIESGPLRLDRSLGPIGTIIDMVGAEIEDGAKAKNIKYIVECDDAVRNLEVEVDRDRIKIAMVLIIKNSIKYVSASGTIKVLVSNLTDHFEIKITDDGIGIAEDMLPKVLDKKYIMENVLNSSEASFSLAYVKHIMEAHGGSVKITSKVGEGSQVTLTVPKYIH